MTHLPVNESTFIEWITYIASTTSLFAATIGTYRSAISTLHAESDWGHLPNPVNTARVSRIIDGIKREKAPREASLRLQREPTVDVTGELLSELEIHQPLATPLTTMCWAAACLGTFAILRISEFIPSPKRVDRAILERFSHLTYCSIGIARGPALRHPQASPRIITLIISPCASESPRRIS